MFAGNGLGVSSVVGESVEADGESGMRSAVGHRHGTRGEGRGGLEGGKGSEDRDELHGSRVGEFLTSMYAAIEIHRGMQEL